MLFSRCADGRGRITVVFRREGEQGLGFLRMRILITGGAGYIGSVLTPMLLQAGHEVTVVDNFLFGQSTLLDCCHNPGFQVVRGDCRDEALMKKLVAKAELIIPLAALVGAPMCNLDKVAAQTTNYDAVKMLCGMVSKEQWIIMPVTNSASASGLRRTTPVSTSSPPPGPRCMAAPSSSQNSRSRAGTTVQYPGYECNSA